MKFECSCCIQWIANLVRMLPLSPSKVIIHVNHHLLLRLNHLLSIRLNNQLEWTAAAATLYPFRND